MYFNNLFLNRNPELFLYRTFSIFGLDLHARPASEYRRRQRNRQ